MVEALKKLPELGLQDAILEMQEEKTELDKVLALLLDPKNIAHNTELSKREILAFSTLSTLDKKYRLSMLRNWLDENLVLRVSKGRAGRKEWVKIVSRQLTIAEQNMEMQNPPRKSWFRGR